jgi:hypothetical protein
MSATVVQAAVAFAAGRTLEGLASAQVLALANGILGTAFGKRACIGLAILLLSSFGILAAYQAAPSPKTEGEPANVKPHPRVVLSPRNFPTVILDLADTQESRDLQRRLENSSVFRIVAVVKSEAAVEDALVQGMALVAIEIPVNYSRRLLRGQPAEVRLLAAGTFYKGGLVPFPSYRDGEVWELADGTCYRVTTATLCEVVQDTLVKVYEEVLQEYVSKAAAGGK